MKITVSDFIISFLEKQGVKHIYGVTGGGALYINDSIARNKNIQFIATNGENCAAYSAVGHAKVSGKLAVCQTSTGCCSFNAVTGCDLSFQDSVPVFFLSGNVNKSDRIVSDSKYRVRGVQAGNIIPVVSSITKFAKTIENPAETIYITKLAYHLAISGRKGSVWVDVPTDIQNTLIEVSDKDFIYSEKEFTASCPSPGPAPSWYSKIKRLIQKSKRPILLLGAGVKSSQAQDILKEFIQDLNCPFVTTYGGINILNHPQNLGVIGTKSERGSSFALHTADLVICVGTSLATSVVGYNTSLFAENAKIVITDIDRNEHEKRNLRRDLFIQEDAKRFFGITLAQLKNKKEIKVNNQKWLNKCLEWKQRWPIFLPEYEDDSQGINIYKFLDILWKHLKDDSTVVACSGSAFYTTCQSFKPKSTNAVCIDNSNASMGYSLPAAVGASFATNKGEVICLNGEGSFAFNLQELQTIQHHKLPVKIFIYNNGGYLSIRSTMDRFFQGRYMGIDPDSGISFVNLNKIAYAYDIPYFKCQKNKDLDRDLSIIMALNSATICEIICPPNQFVGPTVGSKMIDGKPQSLPMYNLFPFLPDRELNKELEEIKNL